MVFRRRQERGRPAWLARALSRMNPPVFLGSALVVVSFVGFGALLSSTAEELFGALQAALAASFGWFYVLTATVLLVLVVFLAFSRYGDVRLGGDDARPEFSYPVWFSMLMAAGMGIGIVFFGVAEPLSHYTSPPTAEPESQEAVREAMRFSFFHWGLHPWAIYSAIALPLAYLHFRHGLPLAPRSLLYPLLGDRIHGWAGHGVDILCTVGTLFGVATSLGLGSIQINGGLAHLFGVEEASGVQVLLIACITGVATLSVVSGIKVGIRFLSQLNIGIAGLLLLFVLVVGPTLYVVELFISSLGSYLQKLPETSLWLQPAERRGWQADWTFFYWAWWLSWSPFVGVFVARISRGRTVREFIVTAFLVPTLIGFLWFSVMGGTGLYLERHGAGGVAALATESPSLSLYALLGELPLSTATSLVATLLIVIFFITSSDSGSLVDDMVTSGGHPNPPRAQRVFWALSEGAVASVLLLGGGLQALRTASLTTGLPMAIFLLVAAFGLVRALRIEARTRGRPRTEDLAPGPPREETTEP